MSFLRLNSQLKNEVDSLTSASSFCTLSITPFTKSRIFSTEISLFCNASAHFWKVSRSAELRVSGVRSNFSRRELSICRLCYLWLRGLRLRSWLDLRLLLGLFFKVQYLFLLFR